MEPVNPPPVAPAAPPVLTIVSGPHIHVRTFSTRRMMADVLIGLLPLIGASFWVFGRAALAPLVWATGAAIAAETLFCAFRRRRPPLGDLSAIVTGVILGLSLPAGAPWYAPVVGAFAAIGLGKAAFGGLGGNIFNPAMVGRAFAMMAFPAALGATAYVLADSGIDVLTQATPLTRLKMAGEASPLGALFLGTLNGSLGETSALAALIGGAYLCLRRTASWEIPLGTMAAVLVFSGIPGLFREAASGWTAAHTLSSGALLYGAFFIATDPVSSPITPKGKFIFGAGFGALVLLIRRWSGYPEGVMFAILLMNALTPLINRACVPVPVGGPVPVKTPAKGKG